MNVTAMPNVDARLASQAACFAKTLDLAALDSTSEYALLLLKNATSDDKSLIIFQRRLMVLAAHQAVLRFYADPTISDNGTVDAPQNLRLGGAASVMSIYTGPTISDNGDLVDALAAFNLNPPDVTDVPIVVPPGGSLLVTVQGSDVGAALYATIAWAEA